MTYATRDINSTSAVASSGARCRYSGGVSASTVARAVAVPESQLYYWTSLWQRNETQAVSETLAGEAVRFDSANEAIHWLLSD